MWELFQRVEEDGFMSFLLVIASIALAFWWLPLALRYLTLLKCARVWIDGDELNYQRWGRMRSLPIDDDLRLRGAGMIYGASKQKERPGKSGFLSGSTRFNAFVFLAESFFGPLQRECFEL
jgi:hypothetical protein